MTNTLSSLPQLADKINRHHLAVIEHATSAIDEAVECGRSLNEAREQLSHGEWLPWLAHHCQVKERQSRNYMRLAREWPAIQGKTAPGADLTIKGALRLLTRPDPKSETALASLAAEINDMHRQGKEAFEQLKGMATRQPDAFRKMCEADARLVELVEVGEFLYGEGSELE